MGTEATINTVLQSAAADRQIGLSIADSIGKAFDRASNALLFESKIYDSMLDSAINYRELKVKEWAQQQELELKAKELSIQEQRNKDYYEHKKQLLDSELEEDKRKKEHSDIRSAIIRRESLIKSRGKLLNDQNSKIESENSLLQKRLELSGDKIPLTLEQRKDIIDRISKNNKTISNNVSELSNLEREISDLSNVNSGIAQGWSVENIRQALSGTALKEEFPEETQTEYFPDIDVTPLKEEPDSAPVNYKAVPGEGINDIPLPVQSVPGSSVLLDDPAKTEQQSTNIKQQPKRTEPKMERYGPYSSGYRSGGREIFNLNINQKPAERESVYSIDQIKLQAKLGNSNPEIVSGMISSLSKSDTKRFFSETIKPLEDVYFLNEALRRLREGYGIETKNYDEKIQETEKELRRYGYSLSLIEELNSRARKTVQDVSSKLSKDLKRPDRITAIEEGIFEEYDKIKQLNNPIATGENSKQDGGLSAVIASLKEEQKKVEKYGSSIVDNSGNVIQKRKKFIDKTNEKQKEINNKFLSLVKTFRDKFIDTETGKGNTEFRNYLFEKEDDLGVKTKELKIGPWENFELIDRDLNKVNKEFEEAVDNYINNPTLFLKTFLKENGVNPSDVNLDIGIESLRQLQK